MFKHRIDVSELTIEKKINFLFEQIKMALNHDANDLNKGRTLSSSEITAQIQWISHVLLSINNLQSRADIDVNEKMKQLHQIMQNSILVNTPHWKQIKKTLLQNEERDPTVRYKKNSF